MSNYMISDTYNAVIFTRKRRGMDELREKAKGPVVWIFVYCGNPRWPALVTSRISGQRRVLNEEDFSNFDNNAGARWMFQQNQGRIVL
jgi:hypothetical protein